MTNQLSNNNNLKRIFILGAGSSISHNNSFPSIIDFFSKAKELGINIEKNLPELQKYVLGNFNIDVTSRKNKVNIETILTQLEIDLERSHDTSLQIIRDRILELIQSVLAKLTERIIDKEGDLNKFSTCLTSSDTILTFNWDILLDNLLGREKVLKAIYNKGNIPSQNCYHHFIHQLSAHGEANWGGLSVSPPYKEWNNQNGFFLKMHGSIDWIFCNNDLCRAFGKGFLAPSIGQPLYCSNCHEPVYPLLIPPVLNKQYRRYHLIRRIWNTAFKEIEIADEIIIWGYSLPETDFYSAWLLRNARKKPIKTLTLINPDVIKGTKEKRANKKFIEKFSNIYEGILNKDSINLFESFNDFLNDVNVKNKYAIKL